MSRKKEYPKSIKVGAVTVKIYRNKTTRTTTGWLYQVAWHDGKSRQVKQFADPVDAEAEARQLAGNLQSGRIEGQTISNSDLDELTSVREIAGSTPPTEALKEWKRAHALCDGHLIEAAKLWKQAHSTAFQSTPLEVVVEKFKASKGSNGVNVKQSYRSYYENLCAAFPNTPINRITTQHLTRYLEKYENAVYRNTHRRRIVTLFRWAAKQGFLPQNSKTQAEFTEMAKEPDSSIAFFAPDQFENVLRLIATDHPHYLAALVLASFCGMRRGEVHAQVWADIDLAAKTVTVTKAKPRTPADRIIPIPDAGILWLLRCPNRTGKVCSNLAIDRIRDIARTSKLETPENGLRHSYISYQMALGNSAGQVAQWAGNTERQIHKHYRRPRPRPEAEKWFSLNPELVLSNKGNLVSMGKK